MKKAKQSVSTTAIMLALAGLVAASQTAGAQARPDIRRFTCGEARSLVARSGAIVLTTGRYTYDRYVSGERFCPIGQVAERAYVQTRDTHSCLIGYRCIHLSPEDRWWWLNRD